MSMNRITGKNSNISEARRISNGMWKLEERRGGSGRVEEEKRG